MNDTICAVATYPSNSAISIIRVSGKDSIGIVNSFFKGKNLEEVDTHTINYGYIVDKENVIDEVLVSIMKAPKTFTRENVVEINVHGSIVIVNKILELLLQKGARIAEPGEFTKRAYLNGRIDLNQAEAVMDLINSKTEASHQMAINQLRGKTSFLIKDIRKELVQIISNIEVNIDYPEYDDIKIITIDEIESSTKKLKQEIEKIIKETESGRYIKQGIKTLILGKPNVGKSSLLNTLLEEEKAIVTNIAGTTRDIVEGSINLGGITLNIVDTAGIRTTTDIIEQKGIDKGIKLIDESDLILILLNNNEELSDEDKEILKLTEGKNRIIIINKTDLPTKINKIELKNENVIEMSVINNKGIEDLKTQIKKIFNLEDLESKNYNFFSSIRVSNLLDEALSLVKLVQENIKNEIPLDIISIDLRRIYDILGEINGESYDEDLLDELFKRFCVGK